MSSVRFGLWLAVSVAVAACAQNPSPGGDPHIAVSLANSGAQPVHCRLMFGHWVERDLGILAPGAEVALDVQQQPKDGALYVLRNDGARRMMIETLICGLDSDWSASVGQVDLAPARSSRPRAIFANCAVSAAGGRVACPPARLAP